jgi:hypothetical protein
MKQDSRFESFVSYLNVEWSFLFLIYMLLMICWYPKEIIQHQALVSTVFKVYYGKYVIFVDSIPYCLYVQIISTGIPKDEMCDYMRVRGVRERNGLKYIMNACTKVFDLSNFNSDQFNNFTNLRIFAAMPSNL